MSRVLLCSVALLPARLTSAPGQALAGQVLAPFSLSEVRLLDGPFKRAEELNRAYLLSLDPDRLLYHFRHNAGLPTTAKPYGGWEAPDWDFYGHTLGHYLTACAQLAAHGHEPEFQRRVDYLVHELAQCQAALARQASHAGFLDPQPESVFKRLERGESNVGVPYYTLHKTMAGLLDAYVLAHNQEALEVLTKIAAWLQFRLDRLSDAQLQTALRIEPGGINEALANLYAITHQPEHLRLAERLNQQLFFEPFSRGDDPLGPGSGPPATRLIHANTQVPKAIAAAREYEVTGTTEYRDVAVNFWQNIARTRSFIIGGNSETEHFFALGTDARHLTPRTAEFCNTYNMLKLTRHLFAWAPSAELMDFYERALFNHVLAAQNPNTGAGTYFMSLEPGGRKRFATPEDTFWCCTGTAMEMESKVADSIYYHDQDSLYLNLFIASELDWRERGLVITQQTRFPTTDTVVLDLTTSTPQQFALRIRYPAWANQPTISVNAESIPVTATPGSYLTIDRVWRDRDRVTIRFPMTVRALPLPDDQSQVAFMYGPLVLAGDLGNAGLQFQPEAFVDNGKDPRGPRLSEKPAAVPALIGNVDTISAHLRRNDPTSLVFSTVGIGYPQEVTLRPLYEIVDHWYTVYWPLRDEAGAERYWKEQSRSRDERATAIDRITDTVWAGLPRSEAAHDSASGDAPIVSSRLSLFREATRGWVSWQLRTVADHDAVLTVGSVDGPLAAFDIFVNGSLLARERPASPHPATPNRATVTTIRTYPIPAARLNGASTLEVRFVGHEELGSCRIVFCQISCP